MVMTSGTYFVAIGIIFVLFVSLCVHHQAFDEMFEQAIDQWDAMKTNERNQCNHEHFLRDLIEFYTSTKE